MNKLFTKVATLCVGLAMAAGVGVAAGASKASEAKAADVTIDLTAQGFENQQDVTTVTSGTFTLTFAKGSGSNGPKYYTSGTSVRTYANNTLTVATSGDDSITKIVFTLGGTVSAVPTANTGSYDSASKTWTGSSKSIVFTNSNSGQYHYQGVTITTSSGGEDDPVLQSIAVSNAKTEYTAGDDFVKPTVTATYDKGNPVDVSNSAQFTGYNLLVAGNYTVTVSYGGKTTTYEIVVNPAQPEGDVLYSCNFTEVDAHGYTQNKEFTLNDKNWVASVSQVNSGVFYLGCNSNNADKGILNNNSSFADVVTVLAAADTPYGNATSTAHAYAMRFANAYNDVKSVEFTWAGGNNGFQVYIFGDKGSGLENLAHTNYATSGQDIAGSVKWSGSSAEDFTQFVVVARPGATGSTAASKSLRAATFQIVGDSDTPQPTKYNVTGNVTNGSVSPSTVTEGGTLTATIKPNSGYVLPESADDVEVTMGGNPVAHSYNVETGVITVNNVTADIVITATCPAAPGPSHAGTKDDPYTVEDAYLAIDSGSGLENVYVTGIVSRIKTSWSTQYNNITFEIIDEGKADIELEAFRCVSSEEHTIKGDDDVAIGATVVMYGTLKKYNSTYELDSGCKIVEYTEPVITVTHNVSFNSGGGTDPQAKEVGDGLTFTFPSPGTREGYLFTGWTKDNGEHYYQEGNTSAAVTADEAYIGEWQTKGLSDNPYTVAEARAAVDANKGLKGAYVVGFVKVIDIAYSDQYQNISFSMVDNLSDEAFVQAFRCKGDEAANVAVGDRALVSGNLLLYGTKYELDSGCVLQTLTHPELVSISVSSAPTKTSYKIGEGLDTTGLVVVANYSFGDPVQLDLKDLELSTFDSSSAGEKTITVTYEGKSTSFKVTVEAPVLQSIEVTSAPTKSSYYVGDTELDIEGLVVTATYDVGDPVVLDNADLDFDFDFSEAGQKKVTVSYEGKTAEFEVEVVVPITDWSDDFKENYADVFGEGAILPPFLGAAFANDEDIYWDDEGYPLCDIDLVDDANLTNFYSVRNAIYGSENWTYLGVSYENQNYVFMSNDYAAFAVVYAYQSKTDGQIHSGVTFETIYWLDLYTKNVKTDYFVGDQLDTTGLIVHYSLVDGEWVNNELFVTDSWTASPSVFTASGDQKVTVTVTTSQGAMNMQYDVSVQEVVPVSIAISGSMEKVAYKEGDAWDTTGLVVTATLNNGKTADVTDQVEWSFDKESASLGDTSVSAVAHLGELEAGPVVTQITVSKKYDAQAFANELLAEAARICSNYDGKKSNKTLLKKAWETLSKHYAEDLDKDEKAILAATKGKVDGNELERAIAFYNYVCKKYGLTPFIAQGQSALVLEQETTSSSTPIIMIVAGTVAAITAIGVVVGLRRRKSILAK